MAEKKLFNIVFENPRDLDRPKQIIMYLDGKNGIHRRDGNLPKNIFLL